MNVEIAKYVAAQQNKILSRWILAYSRGMSDSVRGYRQMVEDYNSPARIARRRAEETRLATAEEIAYIGSPMHRWLAAEAAHHSISEAAEDQAWEAA